MSKITPHIEVAEQEIRTLITEYQRVRRNLVDQQQATRKRLDRIDWYLTAFEMTLHAVQTKAAGRETLDE